MSRKALFFDVDGTLLSEKTGAVPESAVLALENAKRAGNLVIINSGRVYCELGVIRRLIEADGYLCGCGTFALFGDKIRYSAGIPHGRGVQIKRDIVRCDLDGWLESAKALYFRRESRMRQVRESREIVRREGALSPYDWDADCYDYDKFFVISDGQSDREGFLETIRDDLEIVDRGDGTYECMPAGHSKATAMEMALEYYDIPLENAYVFGDSMNDLPMFQYARNAVLMGRHDKGLEPYATFTTRDVEDDGIAHAIRELGLC